MILLEKEKKEKLNIKKYYNQILDKKLFDFWLINMKKLEKIIIIKNKISYHRDIISMYYK